MSIEIDVKGWMETEGRIRWSGKGVLSDGRKYNFHSFGKDKPKGRTKTVKEIYKDGKWRAE